MSSPKQIAANRVNAKRSTGPKSARGKARSKQNAVTHGLTASEIVVAQEEPEQFEAFRTGLMVDFAPKSTIECELVDRLSGLLWRLRRVPVVEAELLRYLSSPLHHYNLENLSADELERLEELLRKAGYAKDRPTRLGLRDIEGPDETSEKPTDNPKPEKLPRRAEMLTILSRYEAGLMNAVTRTLTLLRSLQAARAAAEDDARTVDS